LAISRERKEELVAQYVQQLKKSEGFILADYRGLSVNEMSGIRRAMRPIGGKFQVVKNRLLALALKEAGLSSLPEEWLIGPTAVSFCYDELPPIAKILKEAIQDLETLRIKGGVLEKSTLEESQVLAIADLPSHEELLAQALGTINAPATRLAGVVASGIRQVVNVLKAYADKLQETGEGAPGAGLEQAAEPA